MKIALVAAILAVVVLAAGQPVVAEDPSSRFEPEAEVQALLDRRVAAIAKGDRQDFLATVDAGAPEAFKARQARYFDGWQTVPETDLRLSVRLEDSGDLSPGLNRSRYGDTEVYAPETRQTYRLGEYDVAEAVESLWITYVKRPDGWKLAADDDFAPIGLTSALSLWELAPVSVLATEHVLVIADASQRQRMAEMASMAEEAFAIFSSRWTRTWSQRITLLVPGSAEQVRELLGPSVERENFVAFVSFTPVRTPEYSVSAPRMYAGSALSGQRARRAQVDDLVHELVHAATASSTGPFTPIWLQEGIAEYVRLGSPPAGAVTASISDRLPTTGAFAQPNLPELRKAYDTSLFAVSRLSQRFGPGAPYAYFDRLHQLSGAPGSPAYNADRALRESVGITSGELQTLLVR